MSEDDHLPRLLSGRYRLEATLGHGGMGVVYRGTDLMMKRPVAVKLVRAVDVELDGDLADRFLREAKNTARVQHEHIVEVFDLGRTDEGGLYFVMELLQGESLSARLRREGKLSVETVVHIARQICEALHVAHTAGVIHRDLKPANIMLLSRAGDSDFVKVLDFGVAKSYASDQAAQLTHTGMVVGTVDYMAPEQIRGKLVDGRTDIYSLGVVLYRMLSGQPPFRDTGVPGLIHAHLNTMPKPLIEVTQGVPNELDRVVLRCLAKIPDRRYETMADLARALTSAIMPDDNEFMSLEYGRADHDPDPYASDDQTAIGRPLSEALSADDDPTFNERVSAPYDDATVRIDRPLGFKRPPPRAGLPMTPRIGPGGVGNPSPSRPPIYPDDVATVKRSPTDEYRRLERAVAKACAMCQTMNPAHAVSCLACGVSLALGDQEAVRERVRSVAASRATPIPPTPRVPVFDAQRMPSPPSAPGSHPSGPYGAPSPVQGVPVAAGWLPHQPPPPAPPPSIWQRFLAWTGLRSR